MSPDQQFVKFPVTVLDWRRHLSAINWTVLTVIHDKISRWDKVQDAVSISQIEAETTLSKTAIKESLARLCKSDGPLEVVGRGVRRIPVYSIRPCDRVALRPGHLAAGSSGALYQNGTPDRPAPL